MKATGKVIQAYGNLLHVRFEGDIKQGEVCFVKIKELSLSSEVIEINNDIAKVQVFEDTNGIKCGDEVEFLGHLLQAELGPGLLTSIFDGLQNPLEKIADKKGLYLARGFYLSPLDKEKKWEFKATAKKTDKVRRGDFIGEVEEGIIKHKIMIPFSLMGEYEVTEIVNDGSYTIEDVIAKVKNESGEYEIKMLQKWPVKMPLIEGKKEKPANLMTTGLRIIDTQLPILQGGTFCTPGPFGAGKTVLQHHLAKYSEVDIVIVAACGERAGEVVEILREFPHLIDNRTNKPLIDRTVIICNTSSMPVAAREASVYMGTTIGEYYRQMGYNVLLLADSTSRWAQAMREMSGRLEEIPGEEAFPAYLSSRIAAFYERAGVIKLKDSSKGSLTIGGAVSPAGGNFEEPVTQATLAVVGAFLGLSRERSDARRYPAIDPLLSWTKYLKRAAEEMEKKETYWEEKVTASLKLLKEGYEISKRMEVVGEEGITIDEMIKYLKSELYEICYLQQNAFDKEDEYSSQERQVELFKTLHKIFETKFTFNTHDEARDYFLNLQNQIRNMNFIAFKSDKYNETMQDVYNKIEGKV